MQSATQVQDNSQWALCVQQWVADAGILNDDVEARIVEAFTAVPRHHFVEPLYHHHMFKDVEVPIDEGQWLTKPSLQIRMMGLINLNKRMRVLELGFGSGYLCAVMAAAGAQVFGVDSIGTLAQTSRKNLDALKFHGVIVRRGEGRKGWADAGPFDAIVVSYQVLTEGELPLSQLAEGGVLVAPMTENCVTRLTVWRRGNGGFKKTTFEEVEFR